MYKRVGRGFLLLVGRQIRRQAENPPGAPTAMTSVAVVRRAPGSSYFATRGFCDKSAEGPPKVLAPDEEAEIKLREMMADPEKVRLRKILELEIEVHRQNSGMVPTVMKPRHWLELMNLGSRSKRKNYLAYVFGLEKKAENKAVTKLAKQKARLEELEAIPEDDESRTYRLGAQSMFLRIYQTTMNDMCHSRLMNRMMFGQPLVLDCSYESYMTPREIRNCAKQLKITFATNRSHDDPFDLHFCNANLQGELMKHFTRFIPTVHNPEFPLTIKTESYLDCFDKERLVYLTPHCSNEMTTWDHDAVYIIGAYVDKATNEPVSMAKAKKEGLKMQKFPLDRYLNWGASSGKSLTINHVIQILLDLRMTGSWEEALKTVPRRKLRQIEDAATSGYSPMRPARLGYSQNNESSTTRPMQELKLKERFAYKADQTFKPKAERATPDYKSKADYKNDDDDAPRASPFSMKTRMIANNRKR